MGERKKEYQAGRATTADQPMAMTFRRVDWARIVVALRLTAKQIRSEEDLRLARVIGAALQGERQEDEDKFGAGLAEVFEVADVVVAKILEREGIWVDLPGRGRRVRIQVLEVEEVGDEAGEDEQD